MKEYKYKINGMKFTVSVGDIVDNEATVEVNGIPYKVELDKKPALSQSGQTNHGAKPATTSKPVKQTIASSPDAVKCPLPGTIMSIAVKEGDTVKKGDKVAVLEAMKMENDIRSDKSGTVKKVLVSVGDTLLEGADIMIIE